VSVVTRIRTSAELSVPFTREEVWGVLADVAAYPDWWPARIRVETAGDARQLLGSEVEIRPRMGRLLRFRFEEIEDQCSIRLRFFGGSLEGPGGFHLDPEETATHVRYEMDVFARGLEVAMLSQVLPLDRIHRARMRRVLKSLAGRLKHVRRTADREASNAARIPAEATDRRRVEEEAARKAVGEEAAARVAPQDVARDLTEDDEARRVADDVTARAVAEEAAGPGADVEGGAVPADGTGSRMRALLGRLGQWFRDQPGPGSAPTPETDVPPPPPAAPSESNFEAARRYLDDLSSAAPADEVRRAFAEAATLQEFPHRFLNAAVTRDLRGILAARARALARFKSQRYDLTGATGGGSQVAMEVRFRGTVGSTGDGFTEGQDLEARLAIFLKFAAGKIVRQRTYSCFEPWSRQAERRVILDERLALAGQSVASSSSAGRLSGPAAGSDFDRARNYIDALNARADAEAIASFYTSDAVQEELPNRWTPGGAHRNLEGIKRARQRGLIATTSERYELTGATGGGSQVALELVWSGHAFEGASVIPQGRRLEARFALFLTYRDGLIVRERRYQCA